jgi:uncharacterized protein (TIGR02597 family)
VPFKRTPEYQGLVAGADGNVITVSNANFSPNQWATPNSNGYYPYYVILVTSNGTKEGAYFTITNNTATDLSVVLDAENLTSVSAGDRLQVVPYWTLNTIFPLGTGVVASTSSTVSGRRTAILFPDLVSTGVNLSASAIYYYFNNAWRQAGKPATSNLNDVVVLPDQFLVARQKNTADTSAWTSLGLVPTHRIRIPLYANLPADGRQQDNYVAVYRPAVQTLNESGLTNAFKASSGTTVSTRQDQLLIFNNDAQQKNKSAAAIYYYYNNGWRKAGVPATVDFGASNVFNAATGVIVRKATNTVPTSIWVNAPNY